MTKKGKCISTLVIASSTYSGSGSLQDGGRFPYYEKTEVCLDQDLGIAITSGAADTKKYKIKSNGEIVIVK